jgi:hypothetical protein
MNISDVLEIVENESLPPRIRYLAQALYKAMLALDRYGHMMSYEVRGENGSEADRDRGMVARVTLEAIRFIERSVH